jgi:hypothetical protein
MGDFARSDMLLFQLASSFRLARRSTIQVQVQDHCNYRFDTRNVAAFRLVVVRSPPALSSRHV